MAAGSVVALPPYAFIEGVEDLESYTIGGFHHVKIDDRLHDRYHIIHKLGHGTLSTTWLARDTKSSCLVAIKIACADANKSEAHVFAKLNSSRKFGRKPDDFDGCHFSERNDLLLPLLNFFTIQGSKGTHSCYVTEAAMCSLSQSKGDDEGGFFSLEMARALAAQIACAVAVMHSRGFVHADLHLGNILLQLPRWVHKLSDDGLYAAFGRPLHEKIVRYDGTHHPEGMPSQLCIPVNMGKYCDELSLGDAHILLADFGASFAPNTEQRFMSSSPLAVRPPEDRFEPTSPVSFYSDIWSLGCILWDLVAWRSPFESFSPDPDDTTFEHVSALGPLPAEWWAKWEGRNKYFTDQGKLLPGQEPYTLEQHFQEGVQGLRKELGRPAFSLEEHDAFLALMRSMFAYMPGNRPTIQQVLEAEWMQRWALPEYHKLLKDRDGSAASNV